MVHIDLPGARVDDGRGVMHPSMIFTEMDAGTDAADGRLPVPGRRHAQSEVRTS